jgi:hypothetical protein
MSLIAQWLDRNFGVDYDPKRRGSITRRRRLKPYFFKSQMPRLKPCVCVCVCACVCAPNFALISFAVSPSSNLLKESLYKFRNATPVDEIACLCVCVCVCVCACVCFWCGCVIRSKGGLQVSWIRKRCFLLMFGTDFDFERQTMELFKEIASLAPTTTTTTTTTIASWL